MSKKVMSQITMNKDTKPADLSVSELQLERWQRFIEGEVGFVLPERQHHWLRQAIISVAQAERITPSQLLYRIRPSSHSKGGADDLNSRKLRQQVIDAVLITESRFFRHEASLNFIRTQLNGEQAKDAGMSSINNHVYKVWSVGCSSGQEVWSLAMVLTDCSHPFKIYGSDVNQQVLVQAKEATYSIRELNNIPLIYRHHVTVQGDKFKVSTTLRGAVDFIHHNLFLGTRLFATSVDAIVCQNVLIYFRQFDQRDILAKMVAQLAVGGHLLLAPGEAMGWTHPQMRRVDNRMINAWQKVE